RSIAAGEGFLHAELPRHPPNIERLPGYPIFLAPFVKMVGLNFFWLRATSIGLTLFSCFFLWKLAHPWLTRSQRFFLVALFALNPTTLKYSGSMMSEPLFLFLVLSAFLPLKTVFEEP